MLSGDLRYQGWAEGNPFPVARLVRGDLEFGITGDGRARCHNPFRVDPGVGPYH